MTDEKMSPMMQKYMETKKEYNDCILFYRLGDFYEMFFDDAITASKELELTLTGKNCGLEERAPMCGVPFHAAQIYINKLVQKGYKVAICEQVEDPKEAKGLVKREVTRIATPGTNIDMETLSEEANNYIMCIYYAANSYGIAVSDITTGIFLTTEVDSSKKLLDEIYKYSPSEIICNEAFTVSGFDFEALRFHMSVVVFPLDPWYFDDDLCNNALCSQFGVSSIEGLGLEKLTCAVVSSGALIHYLSESQKSSIDQIRSINVYHVTDYMVLDPATRRNLELTETILDKTKKGSLLYVLDKTKTAMGARMLRSFLEQPLTDKKTINKRLDAVEAFANDLILREELREYLSPVYDLERLMGKINYRSANPRDMLAFAGSIRMLPFIKDLLATSGSAVVNSLCDELDTLEDLCAMIDECIDEDAPVNIKEGGIIKTGYSEKVDSYRNAKTEGKKWLAELEAEDKERTGIKNLRIRYNRVFGYYFEVTNSFLELVPEDYIRKQTLANAERYTTPKLKDLEDTILNAEDKLFSLEYDLFVQLRQTLSGSVDRILKSAHTIALADAYASLGYVASSNNYVRPEINEKGIIDIKEGRHPVVEKMTKDEMFISNDTYLDNSANRISVITGPNMAGKSTYMRQVALIVLMAQIGSFVPAQSANIGIVDRIFTRVGASDDLASGRSTFMVEMTEVANILRNATSKSLLILDEIGRGTSTFDGLSIAWAVTEYISNTKLLGAKTLFATHYHELTELEGKIAGVNNYCIAVKEQKDNIVFLRKIVRGGADKSYGIAVAKLAGLPDGVIARANELVAQLSENDISASIRSIASETPKNRILKKSDDVDRGQMSLFDTVSDEEIIEEIKELDCDNMTPMEALNALSMLQSKLKNRW
ncbi:MAG: DNA mismatch repair protein MutS [Lachnospiraceae bacterium]|nr:DNA mismatch repair protein MutS [Lachnospiraceae bacterium]